MHATARAKIMKEPNPFWCMRSYTLAACQPRLPGQPSERHVSWALFQGHQPKAHLLADGKGEQADAARPQPAASAPPPPLPHETPAARSHLSVRMAGLGSAHCSGLARAFRCYTLSLHMQLITSRSAWHNGMNAAAAHTCTLLFAAPGSNVRFQCQVQLRLFQDRHLAKSYQGGHYDCKGKTYLIQDV